ncbi:MAG TPA: hypothetical protein PLS90_14785, partial [Candidatus Sumerlaeota bacterium]|nr:hypothetical protein [Candidatus Sumerlaeota bacterium]
MQPIPVARSHCTSMIRSLLTIGRYEFRMHLASWRWRGLALLALAFNFGVYQAALFQHSFLPSDVLVSRWVLPLYLLAVVFIGLYSMARIRETGIRPLIMTKAFPTMVLPAGQWLGGMLALALLFGLGLFPAAVALRFTTDIVVYLRPMGWMLVFNLLPGAGLVLACTLWIRACFRHNLTALIILGALGGGLTFVANRYFVVGGEPFVFQFHPLLAPFADPWWRRLRDVELQSMIPLLDPAEWRRVAWMLGAVTLFLHLTTYHLRRTEPQRKVLGTYGASWADMPTFVRLLADLRVDPHVGWRAHLVLGVMLAARLIPARRRLA